MLFSAIAGRADTAVGFERTRFEDRSQSVSLNSKIKQLCLLVGEKAPMLMELLVFCVLIIFSHFLSQLLLTHFSFPMESPNV